MSLNKLILVTGLVVSAITFSLATANSAQAFDLITNGSFEDTQGTFVANAGTGYMSLNTGSTVIPGWTITNQEILWANNSNVEGFATPYGSSFLDLTGSSGHPFTYAGVTQSINTTVGQQYTLSLSLGVKSPFYSGPMSVTATAGSSNQTFTYNPSGSGNQWGIFSFDFTATNISTPISILGISSANQSYFGLDNVSVTSNSQPVPEPLTILGSGIALGFGGFLKRKLGKHQKD